MFITELSIHSLCVEIITLNEALLIANSALRHNIEVTKSMTRDCDQLHAFFEYLMGDGLSRANFFVAIREDFFELS